MFERLSLFAAAYVYSRITPIQNPKLKLARNRINDNSVPYPTAAIETIDHFAQWQDQRLIVDYNDAGIIRSWSREQHDPPPDEKEREKGGRVVKKSLGTYIGTLPPVLRYRFPFNYASCPPLPILTDPQSDNMDEYQLIILLFPIMLPIVLCLMQVPPCPNTISQLMG